MRLLKTNHMLVAPGLRYNPSPVVNAQCGVFSISINAGMLQFVRNDAELALVLGHELAHYKLGHRGSTPSNEFAADALGAIFSSHAGYGVCTGAQVVKRFNDRSSKTHPDSNERYKKLCH